MWAASAACCPALLRQLMRTACSTSQLVSGGQIWAAVRFSTLPLRGNTLMIFFRSYDHCRILRVTLRATCIQTPTLVNVVTRLFEEVVVDILASRICGFSCSDKADMAAVNVNIGSLLNLKS